MRNDNPLPHSRDSSARVPGRSRFSSARGRLAALAAASLTLALTSLASGLAAAPASAQGVSGWPVSPLSFKADALTVSPLLAADDTTSCGDGYTDDPNDPTTTDLVCIPDTGLLDAVDKSLGLTAGTQVTVAQAQGLAGQSQGLTVISSSNTTSFAIADLTGLQVFTNLTTLQLAGANKTYTDLTPISGLTKLTTLALGSNTLGDITDLAPLDGLTNLKTLQVLDPVASFSDISGVVAGLTSFTVELDTHLRLSTLPAMPNMTAMILEYDQIKDPSPLASDLSGAALGLKTLNLSNNGITDASSLAPLGVAGTTLGSTGTLTLSQNRISDFSPSPPGPSSRPPRARRSMSARTRPVG